MSQNTQDIFNKIDDNITSKASPNPDNTLVKIVDLAEILNSIVAELPQLDPGVFEPFDPAQEYSNAGPDYVSYNENTYEYIGATPSTGNLPTNTTYWKPASAGQFNHIQNTDLGTSSETFIIQRNSQNQGIEGITVLGFETQQGETISAIGLHWFNDGVNPPTQEFKVCFDYTGDILYDDWLPFEALLGSNVAKRNEYNEFTQTQTILRSATGWAITSYEATDPNLRFGLKVNGEQSWGDGTNPSDVTLNRQDAGRLQVTGKLNATNGLQHKGADLIAYKTGTVVDFAAVETEFNTEAVPGTTNITANHAGAVVGHMAFMTHNNGTAPTFGSEFHKIAGSGDYELGVNNYIYFDYRSATRINYSITQ